MFCRNPIGVNDFVLRRVLFRITRHRLDCVIRRTPSSPRPSSRASGACGCGSCCGGARSPCTPWTGRERENMQIEICVRDFHLSLKSKNLGNCTTQVNLNSALSVLVALEHFPLLQNNVRTTKRFCYCTSTILH